MASELDEFEKNIENLRSDVRKSFARVYATIKARELKTLRQLDALRKQSEDDPDLKRNCVQNIRISYEIEPTLLENVSNFGAIDFEKLNFDSSTFLLEDYVSPEDDHMYLYKTIEKTTMEVDDNLAIEEAALRQITAPGNCVCFVNIRTEDVAKKFRVIEPNTSPIKVASAENIVHKGVKEVECPEISTDECKSIEESKSCNINADRRKIDPTDDWLESIKGQTETEPSQTVDVMEHSTITCL